MSLPGVLLEALTEEVCTLFGASCSIVASRPIFGGDINEAARLTLSDGRALFLKYNPAPLPGLFEVEARGLKLLKSAGTLRVPEVFAVVEATRGHPAFILMEWIEPDPSPDGETMREFGRGLARLHGRSSGCYGLDHDNYIGSLPQPNGPAGSWVAFYRDRRLGAQLELAKEGDRLPPHRERRLGRLMEQLDRFVPEEEVQPSLLHGDLWGGNAMVSRGEAVLIDPAVYYGHREVELAFTELFGGFPEEFYRGYREAWPLSPEYEQRKALYQLYPLLVHLNLFGESYGGRVDRVLRRYIR